jgi:DNA-binding MarR family transcriptional regulator
VVSKRNVPETRQTVKDAEYRALSDFRKCIHDYLDFSDRTARAAGIEPRQYQLLLAIRATSLDSEPSVGTLAQHLRIRHHSAVELIDRAGRNGFVKRERSANGSNVLVRLTSKGHRVLERAVAERLEELQSAGPSLVDALRRLLGFKGNSRSKRK